MNGIGYAIGGAVHGDLDGMVITSKGEGDVYEVELIDGSKVALSDDYYVMVQKGNAWVAKSIKNVYFAEKILKVNNSSQKVVSISKRKGIILSVPRDEFSLNDIIVSRNGPQLTDTQTLKLSVSK